MALFTDYQIRQLAWFVRQDYGDALTDSRLNERIGLLLEDIAACELASDAVIQSTIDQIRSAYHDIKNRR